MRKLLPLLFLLIFFTFSLQAQELDTTMWVANQAVNAVTKVGNTIYIGGSFNHIGPNTGGGAVYEPSTGKVDTTFPRINGKITSSISDGKGGWFLAGEFNKVGGVEREKIIHILADNTVDLQWNPVVDGTINCLALANNTLYLGGHFNTPDAPYIAGIMAINAETGKILNWKTPVHYGVLTLAVSDGKVYAGGNFRLSDSQEYKNLVSFDATTGLTTSWNSRADGTVEQIIIHQNVVYARGYFGEIGGEKRMYLGAVDATTGLATSWNVSPDAQLAAMTLSDDILYLSGSFSFIAGQPRKQLAAINLLNGTLTNWKPNLIPFGLYAPAGLAVDGNTVYAGGAMPVTDHTHGTLAALDKETGNIKSWHPSINGPVHTLSFFGGKLFLGGSFSSVGGEPRIFLAAMDAISGKLLPWNPRVDGYVNAVAAIGNTIFIGGSFRTVGGQPRQNFAAIDATTGVVTNIVANTMYPINKFLVYENKLFINGWFSTIGDKVRNSIALLDPLTGQITDWDAKLGGWGANCMTVYNNKLYIGGDFTMAGGESRQQFAAFDIETGKITAWNPGGVELGIVTAIAGANGKIYVGGGFSKIAGKAQKFLAALDPNSGTLLDWDVNPDRSVMELLSAGDSLLYVGGYFNSIGNQLRNKLASINTHTGIVTDWKADIGEYPYNPGSSFPIPRGTDNVSPRSILVAGKTLYVTGAFRSINNFALGGGFAAFGERPEAATNIIIGNIFNDLNANCVREQTEAPLPNLIIVAQPGNFYASTDSSGNYELVVPRGKYQISQILPQAKGFDVSQLCPAIPSYSIVFSGKNESITGKDFANKANIQPFLSVDIASDRRRRCFRNQTTVSYRNEGLVPAAGVEIKVEYPEYVIPLSSSIPWKSRQGNTLIFDLGTVLAHASGSISITDSVTCGDESIRGLTQCTKAFITPLNQLPADTQWDQSSLALFAKCKENGFVGLVIKNIGNGNMADSTNYRIFLDAKLVFTAKCKLNKNDSLTLEVPVNGRTIRLEADQVAYYPTDSKPSVTLEGCGSTAQTPISKGYVDQLPQDDAEPEVAISCMPILDSYDPNDKSASPAGITASKIIRKEDVLEYTIRFQNTGNDVAYTVIIEDELSEYLDLSTLRTGASSHPCSWKIGGEGKAKLTWTFNNILLPDSTTNEPGSHGFVQFSIAQMKDNALGTTITNKAQIYFDYNSPIVTNMVIQTVGVLPVATQRIAVNMCDGAMPDQAYAGENKQLRDASGIQLQANTPDKGYGRWKLISGAGTIVNPSDPQSQVLNLDIGKNVFEWSVYLCDQQTSSQVTIERVVIPSPPLVQAPAAYCEDELIRPLIAKGENIEWFADPQAKQLLGTGETYQPVVSQTDSLYVTQIQYGYRSLAQMVIVQVKSKPSAPEAPSPVYYCKLDKNTQVTAAGENLVWYADKVLTKQIGEGSPFFFRPNQDTLLFVVQRVNGCPSAASAVTVKAGTFAPKKTFIANVITPNGDEKNESFTAPVIDPELCVGKFESLQIYNRYGKKIYESKDPHFSWNGSGVAPGVFYYVLTYSAYTYSGILSVLY